MEKFPIVLLIIVFKTISSQNSPLLSDLSNEFNPQRFNTTVNQTAFRQDEDGDGPDGLFEGLQAVAGPVSNIIAGSLTGNLGQLFNGVSGTIADQETQSGVNQILSGVANPFNQLWTIGFSGAQKLLNITTMNPNKMNMGKVTPSPLAGQQPGQFQQVAGPQQFTPQQIMKQQMLLQQQKLLQQQQLLIQQQLAQANLGAPQQQLQPQGSFSGVQQPQGAFSGVPTPVHNQGSELNFPPTRSTALAPTEDEDDDDGENDFDRTREITW